MILVLLYMKVLKNSEKEGNFGIWTFWLWFEYVHFTIPCFLSKYGTLIEKNHSISPIY